MGGKGPVPGGQTLVERDPWLGLEPDGLGNAGLLAPLGILGPALGQVKPVRQRQTAGIVGNRERHCDLTILLLAQLPAILPGHADRMLALLGKRGVVDDPRPQRPGALQTRQDQIAHPGQHRLVRPPRLAQKMQQRLMLRGNPRRRGRRRQRLDALARHRKQETPAIVPQRRCPVRMADHPDQSLDIGLKSLFDPTT